MLFTQFDAPGGEGLWHDCRLENKYDARAVLESQVGRIARGGCAYCTEPEHCVIFGRLEHGFGSASARVNDNTAPEPELERGPEPDTDRASARKYLTVTGDSQKPTSIIDAAPPRPPQGPSRHQTSSCRPALPAQMPQLRQTRKQRLMRLMMNRPSPLRHYQRPRRR